MRYFTLLSLALLFVSCEKEKLKMNAHLSGVEETLFHPGTSVTFEVEHNGEGIALLRKNQVLSNSAQLTIDEQFGYGVHPIRMVSFRDGDTVEQRFRLTVAPNEAPAHVDFSITNTYPHPAELFTQGLILDGDMVIESSGQYGESALSIYKLGSTKILQQHRLPNDWFAEGLALLNDTLYQITWKKGAGQTYYWDGSSFTPTRSFNYKKREGWGLSAWNNALLWTDGTERLRTVNPQTMDIEKTTIVLSNIGVFANLNELEPYKGYLAANLWQTDRIAFIHPETGVVDRVLDLNDIAENHRSEGTLNGMMVKGDHLIVTGKNWSTMYELELNWE